MKHEAINVDDPESFKESVLDVLEWTEQTIFDALMKELTLCLVDEDAGCRVRLPARSYRTQDSVVAWVEVPVTDYALSVYKPRLDAAATNLSKLFHVEQSQRQGARDECTIHKLLIRHEYHRSV